MIAAVRRLPWITSGCSAAAICFPYYFPHGLEIRCTARLYQLYQLRQLPKREGCGAERGNGKSNAAHEYGYRALLKRLHADSRRFPGVPCLTGARMAALSANLSDLVDSAGWVFGRPSRAKSEARSHECERCTHECARHDPLRVSSLYERLRQLSRVFPGDNTPAGCARLVASLEQILTRLPDV
jgi:hypothetical protein